GRSGSGWYAQNVPVRTRAARWSARPGCRTAIRCRAARSRCVTVERARSARRLHGQARRYGHLRLRATGHRHPASDRAGVVERAGPGAPDGDPAGRHPFDVGAAPVPSRTRWLLAAITGAALLAVALVVWPKRHVLAEARRRRRASYEAGAEGRF